MSIKPKKGQSRRGDGKREVESERKAKLRMPAMKQQAECGQMSERYVFLRTLSAIRRCFNFAIYDLMETERNVVSAFAAARLVRL